MLWSVLREPSCVRLVPWLGASRLDTNVALIWVKTQLRSWTTIQASSFPVALPIALIHQESAMTTTYIPVVPPFAKLSHFSSSGTVLENPPSATTFLQDGCMAAHHFINNFPYLSASTVGAISFLLMWRLTQTWTSFGRWVVGNFYHVIHVKNIKLFRKITRTPETGFNFSNSTKSDTRFCQSTDSDTPRR